MRRFLLAGLFAIAIPAASQAQIFVGGGVRVPGVPTFGNMNF